VRPVLLAEARDRPRRTRSPTAAARDDRLRPLVIRKRVRRKVRLAAPLRQRRLVSHKSR
jgi:hypothetical protein